MKAIWQFIKSLNLILIIYFVIFCAGCAGISSKFKKARLQITSDDWHLRKEAVEVLGEINNKQTVELLISTLKDKNWSVRGSTAEILGKIKNPIAVEPLILAINDKNNFVSWKAIEALGVIGDNRAVEPIINKLDTRDFRLKKESIRALGKIGDKKAAEPIISLLKNAEKEIKVEICAALDELNVIPSNDNDKVIFYITKKNWNECVNIGKPAVKLLINQLNDEDSEVRIGITKALGKMQDNSAVEPLILALNDNNSFVRGNAAESLGNIGDNRAVEPLILALKDSDGYVRTEASRALGSINDSRAVGPLINAINDNDKNVQSKAVESLAKICKPNLNFGPIIIAICNNKDFSYRIRLADALIKIGEPAVNLFINIPNPNYENDVRIISAYALGKIKNSRAVNPLIAMFRDSDIYVQLAVIGALGEIGDVSATGPLISIIKNNPRANLEGSAIQKKALEALGNIGDKSSIEFIIPFLKNGDDDVRKSAANALGKTGDKRAIEPLIETLKDGEWLVRKKSAEALDQLEWVPANKTEQALYYIAQNEWDKCAKIGKPAIEPLIDIFIDQDPFIIRHIEGALFKIGDPAVNPLINALGHKNWHLRAAASKTLGIIGKKQAVKPLIIVLKDENGYVREEASEALGNIGDKYAIKPLIETLKDGNRGVRTKASIALDKIKWIPANESEKAQYYIAKEDWDKCVEIGKPAVEPLIDALKWGDNIFEKVKETLIKIDRPAIESLVAALDDKDWRGRQIASEVLSIIINNRTIKPLTLDLKDTNWQVRMNAADVLSRINCIPDDDIEKAYYFIAKREWDKCADLGKPAVEPLLELFGSKIKNVSYMDVYQYSPWSSAYITRNITYVRGEASKALVKIGLLEDEEAVNTIKKALNNHELNNAAEKILKEIIEIKASRTKMENKL